jgi:rod shape-determining protein MreB
VGQKEKIFKFIKGLPSGMSWEVGVDLGSSNTLIYLKDRGIVIEESTTMARLKKKRWTGMSAPKVSLASPVAFGIKAKEMEYREPKQIEVINPIKNGIVADLEGAEKLVGYFMKLVYEIPSAYPKIFKPKIVVGVPSFVTEVQKRAVKQIFLGAGAREVVLVDEAILAAMGLGLSLDKSQGILMVDIGGGKTEVGVLSAGGLVVGRGIKTAGNDFDEAIINYIKMKYGLLIGKSSAEKAKIEVGNMDTKEDSKRQIILRGRDLDSSLPKSIRVNETEIREAVSLEVGKIVRLVSEVLDETPPEMMDDIMKRGIIMVGGGSKLRGIDSLIEQKTKINVEVAEDPELSVIKGCGELISDPKKMKLLKKYLGG